MVMDAMRMNEGNVSQCPIIEEKSNADATRFFDPNILTNHYGMTAQTTVNYQP
jgi:hypothetical protein